MLDVAELWSGLQQLSFAMSGEGGRCDHGAELHVGAQGQQALSDGTFQPRSCSAAPLIFLNALEQRIRSTQGQQVLSDGIGRGTEEEEDLDPVAAREYLTAPSRLLQLDSHLVQKVCRRAAWLPSCALPWTLLGLLFVCRQRERSRMHCTCLRGSAAACSDAQCWAALRTSACVEHLVLAVLPIHTHSALRHVTNRHCHLPPCTSADAKV